MTNDQFGESTGAVGGVGFGLSNKPAPDGDLAFQRPSEGCDDEKVSHWLLLHSRALCIA